MDSRKVVVQEVKRYHPYQEITTRPISAARRQFGSWPVSMNWLAPPPDTLPDSLRPLLQYNAALIQGGGGYERGVERVIATVLERLDDTDETPEEEKWILSRIADTLQNLNRAQIARMGSELSRMFAIATPSPKSVRAVARTIYGIGPASLECLLALGESGQRIGRLIKLLATHWIKADVARSLRAGLRNDEARQPIAIACEYPEFTPDETLLKASYVTLGWPTVVVKPADPAREIVLQVHEALANYFTKWIARTAQRPRLTSGSDDDRLRSERDAINIPRAWMRPQFLAADRPQRFPSV